MRFAIIFVLAFFSINAFANPYWDPNKVPKDAFYLNAPVTPEDFKLLSQDQTIDVLRVQVDWNEQGEAYKVSKMVIEPSGTPTLIARSKDKPLLGSYMGVLIDNDSGKAVYYDSIGTGKEYRKLTRAISLRFPVPEKDMTLVLYAENPVTGVMEKVTTHPVKIKQLKHAAPIQDVEVRELALASKTPALRVGIYAEGYTANERNVFWDYAVKTVKTLKRENFPGVEYMSFYGVFHPSNNELGEARDLGLPVPEYDTFLGMFYPYWDKFGRWYNVLYPTRENKLRENLAAVPYDYPIVLVNSQEYWGVGNYHAFTAIPVGDYYFTYILMHEFGHFFGLNEEYVGGGPTELEFAPDITEPWSQNITFLVDNRYESLKWKSFVDSSIPLPTPSSYWRSSPPVYGAYENGYGGSTGTKGSSHTPGLDCTMQASAHFCDICAHAIEKLVRHGAGA